MSTHAFIGVVENTGTLKYVYNHSDGYPSYLGKMLLEHYNTPELATALVNLVMIDDKALYIHRANFQIIDLALLNQ